jgi:hypothetical protein
LQEIFHTHFASTHLCTSEVNFISFALLTDSVVTCICFQSLGHALSYLGFGFPPCQSNLRTIGLIDPSASATVYGAIPRGHLALVSTIILDDYNLLPINRCLFISRTSTHMDWLFCGKGGASVRVCGVVFVVVPGHIAKGLRRWHPRAAIPSLLATSIYAILDEFHQSFTLERSGNIIDILLDWCGAFFSLLALWIAHRSRLWVSIRRDVFIG